MGHCGSQSPLSASWFSRWQPPANCFEPSGHLVILLSYVHLFPLFLCFFTLVHLLIDGSVEGQYITISEDRRIKTFINSLQPINHDWSHKFISFNTDCQKENSCECFMFQQLITSFFSTKNRLKKKKRIMWLHLSLQRLLIGHFCNTTIWWLSKTHENQKVPVVQWLSSQKLDTATRVQILEWLHLT